MPPVLMRERARRRICARAVVEAREPDAAEAADAAAMVDAVVVLLLGGGAILLRLVVRTVKLRRAAAVLTAEGAIEGPANDARWPRRRHHVISVKHRPNTVGRARRTTSTTWHSGNSLSRHWTDAAEPGRSAASTANAGGRKGTWEFNGELAATRGVVAIADRLIIVRARAAAAAAATAVLERVSDGVGPVRIAFARAAGKLRPEVSKRQCKRRGALMAVGAGNLLLLVVGVAPRHCGGNILVNVHAAAIAARNASAYPATTARKGSSHHQATPPTAVRYNCADSSHATPENAATSASGADSEGVAHAMRQRRPREGEERRAVAGRWVVQLLLG
jgi:hypothetical protein